MDSVVTINDSSASPSGSKSGGSNVGAIVGIVFGCLAALGAVGGLLFVIRKKAPGLKMKKV